MNQHSGRVRGVLLSLAVALIAGGGLVTGPAQAAGPRPLFQLPFPCGETWRLATYPGHDDYDIDMTAVSGTTQGRTIIASYSGTVSFAGWDSGGGWMVRLNHGDGWSTLYLHMIARPVVSNGESVEQGEKLGNVGSTGNSSGPHLHYEQLRDGAKVESYFDSVRSGITTDGNPSSEPISGPVNRTSQNCGPTAGRGVDVASWGPGRLDVFTRGGDDRLKHRWFDNGEWSQWEDLGGVLTADPTAVSWGEGRLDVFVRGTNHHLYHKYYRQGVGWSSGYDDLGGILTSAPDAASWAQDRLDIFARGGENQLVHKWFTRENGWSDWEHLGGNLTSGPAAVADQPGRLNVFARGGDHQLVQKYYSGSWSSWQDLGGTLTSDPDAVSREPDRISVFVRGGGNRLFHKHYLRGEGWSSFENFEGNLASAPGAASREPERINVFARNTNNQLVQRYYIAGSSPDAGWSAWQNLGTMP
jgi:Peptidase family M23/Repeat of unknown function (DUF346)